MLKTAEFAKMCHTTKDTLIFYDRIDVFKPAFVDSKKIVITKCAKPCNLLFFLT